MEHRPKKLLYQEVSNPLYMEKPTAMRPEVGRYEELLQIRERLPGFFVCVFFVCLFF